MKTLMTSNLSSKILVKTIHYFLHCKTSIPKYENDNLKNTETPMWVNKMYITRILFWPQVLSGVRGLPYTAKKVTVNSQGGEELLNRQVGG